jgi:hypothetical protein
VRDAALDRLASSSQHEAQHPVGRRVLRAQLINMRSESISGPARSTGPEGPCAEIVPSSGRRPGASGYPSRPGDRRTSADRGPADRACASGVFRPVSRARDHLGLPGVHVVLGARERPARLFGPGEPTAQRESPSAAGCPRRSSPASGSGAGPGGSVEHDAEHVVDLPLQPVAVRHSGTTESIQLVERKLAFTRSAAERVGMDQSWYHTWIGRSPPRSTAITSDQEVEGELGVVAQPLRGHLEIATDPRRRPCSSPASTRAEDRVRQAPAQSPRRQVLEVVRTRRAGDQTPASS